MGTPLNQGIPAHLANMNLAITPQQYFERADRMLTQAATLRDCADKLQTEVDSLYEQANETQSTALKLQRRGMRDRDDISQVCERLVEVYHEYLVHGETNLNGRYTKLCLAVEEGRAFMEQVESFEDEIIDLVKRIGDSGNCGPGSVTHESDNDISTHSQDESVEDNARDLSGMVHGSNAPTIAAHLDRSESLGPTCATNLDKRIPSSAVLSQGIRQPLPTFPEMDEANPMISQTASRKRKHTKLTRTEGQAVERVPVSKHKLRREKRIEKMKKKVLSDMGWDNTKVPATNFDTVEPPPKKRSRNRERRKIDDDNNTMPEVGQNSGNGEECPA